MAFAPLCTPPALAISSSRLQQLRLRAGALPPLQSHRPRSAAAAATAAAAASEPEPAPPKQRSRRRRWNPKRRSAAAPADGKDAADSGPTPSPAAAPAQQQQQQRRPRQQQQASPAAALLQRRASAPPAAEQEEEAAGPHSKLPIRPPPSSPGRRSSAAPAAQQAAAAVLAGQRQQQASQPSAAATLEPESPRPAPKPTPEQQAERRRRRQEEQAATRAELQYSRSKTWQLPQQVLAAASRGGLGAAAAAAEAGWDIEAAAMLCDLGMSTEEAVEALMTAHAYALRRSRAAASAEAAQQQQQQQQENGKEGQQAEQPPDAAASAAVASAAPPPTAGQVQAACQALLDIARLPVGRLRHVLAAAPQLLACSPEELRKQHEVLASVWRRPRRLVAAIVEHPSMLAPEFPAMLGRALQELSSLGFSRDQVSAIILRCPAVTQFTRQQVDATLRRAGLNLSDAMGSEEVVSFLAAHPHLLGGPGAAQLSAKLRLFASWRLAPPLRALLLARCPPLLAESEEQLQGVVDVLLGYGVSWQQLQELLLGGGGGGEGRRRGYPALLRLDLETVRLTLKLLADFDISFDKVARYPRVFIHDPVRYLGPRLAYLKAFAPAKLRQNQLVSILSRGDDEFASLVCGRLPDEYAVFKDAWMRQFEEAVDTPPRPRAGGARLNLLSERLWSRETTDELWL